jgi:hypothetical protein
MAEGAAQFCPICRAEVNQNPRYPDYLCRDCAQRTTDESGRAVRFQNASPDSPNLIEDLTGTYADGSPYMSQTCFVDGAACYAKEARFGGIVVRPQKKAGPWG